MGVFHRESYHHLTEGEAAQITARYDDPESHLSLSSDWASQGHKHYLDWLFTEWLGGRNEPTAADTAVFRFLKKSGFVEPHSSKGAA